MNQFLLAAIAMIVGGVLMALGKPETMAAGSLALTAGLGFLGKASKDHKEEKQRRVEAEDAVQDQLGQTQSLQMDIDVLEAKLKERQQKKI